MKYFNEMRTATGVKALSKFEFLTRLEEFGGARFQVVFSFRFRNDGK